MRSLPQAFLVHPSLLHLVLDSPLDTSRAMGELVQTFTMQQSVATTTPFSEWLRAMCCPDNHSKQQLLVTLLTPLAVSRDTIAYAADALGRYYRVGEPTAPPQATAIQGKRPSVTDLTGDAHPQPPGLDTPIPHQTAQPTGTQNTRIQQLLDCVRAARAAFKQAQRDAEVAAREAITPLQLPRGTVRPPPPHPDKNACRQRPRLTAPDDPPPLPAAIVPTGTVTPPPPNVTALQQQIKQLQATIRDIQANQV